MSDEPVSAVAEAGPAGAVPSLQRRKTPFGLWFIYGVLAVVAVVLAVKLLQETAARSYSGGLPGAGTVPLPGATRGASVPVGSIAPDLSLQTLDGKPASLADFRGQVVMVNFWATWCPPCRAEMPDMQQVYDERRGRDFTILAVNIQEAQQPVAGFVTKYGLGFPILMDVSGEVTQRYGVYSLPSSYFVDRDGRVAKVNVGPLSKRAIAGEVDRLLE